MERLVVFKLDGTFDRGFQVQLEIWSATTDTDALSGSRELVDRGFLPPNPQLLTCLYEHWNRKYRQIGAPARRKAYYRLKPQEILYDGCLNAQIRDCHRSAQHLEREFEQWLHSESLQDIELRLREEIDPRETVRFLIHTDDPHLPKLPWHLWRFFKRYRQAEVAFCPTECKKLDRAVSDRPHVKILAVLGHRNGIDVESDLQILQALPNAEVTFLVEPNRQDINDRLWLEPWDIIFFAGHSETEGEEGRIYLNPHESLSISELWFGLRTAVDRGLRLAIFNSCDGLGLTRKLDDLQIPIAIVMRELVPDRVAQAFLKYFLTSFSSGQPFFLAVREARERLQGLENKFPCASWLPLIYQNPIEVPPTWEQLQCPPKRPPRSRSIQTVGLVSFLVTLFVMGARSLGILEPLELLAYDWLMRRRPPESIDSRITVVEVTEKDLRYYGNPLSDEVLARLTAKLTAETPTAIGFNLYLARPQGGGREALMQQLETHPDLVVACAYGPVDEAYNPPSEMPHDRIDRQMGFSNLTRDRLAFQERGLFRNFYSPGDWWARYESNDRGVVRRYLLSYMPSKSPELSVCSTPYSLAWQLAVRALERHGVAATVNDRQEWQLGDVAFPMLGARFGGYQSLRGLSNQILLRYRANPPGQRLTLRQVLGDEFDENLLRDAIQDKVVLVGYVAGDRAKLFDTPYGVQPSVWIHAHAVSHLLSAVLDGRPSVWVLPLWGTFLWVCVGSCLAGGCVIALADRSPLLRFGSIAIVFGVLYQTCAFVFVGGGWLPLVPSMLAVVGTSLLTVKREA